MKVFFFFSLFYALLAVLLAYMVRDNVAAVLDFGVTKAVNNIWRFFVYLKLLSLGLVCLLYFTRKFGLRDRIIDAAYAFFGCLVFAGAFSIVKTSIPFLNPFYADTMLADLDQSLHLGWNPWEIVHLASDIVSPQFVETVYFWTWMLPAFFLPVIIALTDFNPERRARFLVLHCACWILLGNVLALAFSSVGPVYYDLLLSDNRFLDLRQALAATGIADSQLGQSQAYLWYDYENRGQAFGSGISAFPSVHVGVALVVALYAAERSVYLAPFGIVFLAAVLFCSVYNGWHYAIDGYASIAVLTLFWFAQKRLSSQPDLLSRFAGWAGSTGRSMTTVVYLPGRQPKA